MTAKKAEQALTDVIRRRHLSYSTEQSYLYWLRSYERFLREAAPQGDHTAKVTQFLSSLAGRDLSASSQNQALQALLMFYREVIGTELGRVDALRAKRPQFIRYAPSQEEVKALLAATTDLGGYPTRLIAHLLYGCGLRVSEPLNLRLKDVDLDNSRLSVRQGKGSKDRYVVLPCCLAEPMRRQLALATARWEQDASAGLPVPLPHQLARKYPSAAYSRGWYWLFPAHNTCRHPRTGKMVRYRCLETNVQRAVRKAAIACGLDSVVTPHCLRHAFATHSIERGGFVRDLQTFMGHASLETTMGYVHADTARVPLPLDSMAAIQ